MSQTFTVTKTLCSLSVYMVQFLNAIRHPPIPLKTGYSNVSYQSFLCDIFQAFFNYPTETDVFFLFHNDTIFMTWLSVKDEFEYYNINYVQ